MEIQEREAFNVRLVRFCINHSLLNNREESYQPFPMKNESEASSNIASCLSKVLAAEQVFRADFLQGRPGMPVEIAPEED